MMTSISPYFIFSQVSLPFVTLPDNYIHKMIRDARTLPKSRNGEICLEYIYMRKGANAGFQLVQYVFKYEFHGCDKSNSRLRVSEYKASKYNRKRTLSYLPLHYKTDGESNIRVICCRCHFADYCTRIHSFSNKNSQLKLISLSTTYKTVTPI